MKRLICFFLGHRWVFKYTYYFCGMQLKNYVFDCSRCGVRKNEIA